MRKNRTVKRIGDVPWADEPVLAGEPEAEPWDVDREYVRLTTAATFAEVCLSRAADRRVMRERIDEIRMLTSDRGASPDDVYTLLSEVKNCWEAMDRAVRTLRFVLYGEDAVNG